jgi:UDP-N-acetylmuramyl pentapeptide phosphotransferase/UDP-N-acetylglucosamine-1-phosphate transferase
VLPVALGYGLALAEVAFGVLVAVRPTWLTDAGLAGAGAWFAGGTSLVFLAGVVDDRRPVRVRGLRTHLRAVALGRVTTGILKLVVAIAAALAWVLVTHASVGRVVLGVPVIAGMTNLFNLFDVAPGRSLKYALVTLVGLALARADVLVAVTAGACAALLPFDLRERGMLGDAGSNVLGFALGIALYERLGTAGLAIALLVLLGLHAVADSVTFSRVIAGTPPLRWFDALGRLPTPPPPEERRGNSNP